MNSQTYLLAWALGGSVLVIGGLMAFARWRTNQRIKLENKRVEDAARARAANRAAWREVGTARSSPPAPRHAHPGTVPREVPPTRDRKLEAAPARRREDRPASQDDDALPLHSPLHPLNQSSSVRFAPETEYRAAPCPAPAPSYDYSSDSSSSSCSGGDSGGGGGGGD